ncbi:uncharacterized protein LOC118517002 [Anopheles stephensi]|uniref:uncharacterized protein LOC118517002 n=1 Tax=Anopheles stephensi TaxID=30069 RepID=UPI0016589165|nr:uncharacterized protein LOC118517002 [Anopheles stephensi]
MPKRGRRRSRKPDSVGSSSDSAESKRSRSVVSSSSEESDDTMSVDSTESRSSTSVQEDNLSQFVTVNRRQRKTVPTTKPSTTPATPAVPAGRTSAPAPVSAAKMPPITVKSLPVAVLRPELQARGITPEFRISGVAPRYNLAKRLQDIKNAPDTPATTPTTTPATTSSEDLFSPEELFAIFSRMLPKIRLCRNKGEQIAVIGELLMLLH